MEPAGESRTPTSLSSGAMTRRRRVSLSLDAGAASGGKSPLGGVLAPHPSSGEQRLARLSADPGLALVGSPPKRAHPTTICFGCSPAGPPPTSRLTPSPLTTEHPDIMPLSADMPTYRERRPTTWGPLGE
jgi:hypothetical protein